MEFDTEPLERHLRQHLPPGRARQRFDRAKQFVDRTLAGTTDEALAHRLNARWLKFLCSRAAVQKMLVPETRDVLHRFAKLLGLPPVEERKFVGLSLTGALWRSWCFEALRDGPAERVARLTRVEGWGHFERSRQAKVGLILLPFHSSFSRLFQPYLRHRGYDGLEIGTPSHKLEQKGPVTPAAKGIEHGRQMHAAKQLLSRGGIAINVPDARQNLGYARPAEFLGRRRMFAAGFAELALLTGAHLLPLAHRFSPRGCFVLEFGAPLRMPAERLGHEARLDALVGQYASFVGDAWRRHPWNITWLFIRHYLQLPDVDRIEGSRRVQGVPQ